MYEFEVNDAIIEILDKSYNKEKTVDAVTYVSNMLKEKGIKITDYRWQSLVNHIAAIVERSFTGEKLEGIEADMFGDVSKKSLDIAEAIVNKIGNLPQNEMYLLSIHFETAEIE